MSLAILNRLIAIVFSCPLASTTRVLGALRFEMISRFAKCDAGALFEMPHHFRRENRDADSIRCRRRCRRGPVPARLDRFLRALPRVFDLLRVAAEFLAEPDRRRIHQMGAADLDDVPELLRLFASSALLQVFPARATSTFFSCSAALMCMAVGITSLLDCPMLT